MIPVYFICVAVSIAMCFWYFLVDVRRGIIQNIMLLVMTLANIGYLSLALQTDVSGAIISCKIYYLGACFLPLLYFLTVCGVCNIRVRVPVITVLTIIQMFVFFAVCTIGYNNLFYTDVDLVFINGVCTLARQYGPLHFLHPLTMYAYLAASLFVALYACFRMKNVYKSGIVALVICEVLTSSYYLIDKLLFQTCDLTPIVYIVLMAGALVPIYKSDVFAVVENEDVIDEQLEKVGFISFDKRMRYMGANECALNLFESLGDTPLGKKIASPPGELVLVLQDIEAFLEECEEIRGHQHRNSANLKIGLKTFETEIHSLLSFHKHTAGVTLELRDVTDHVRVLELTEKYNEKLNQEVELKTEKIRSMQEKTILGMSQMVESRDLSTGGHIKRTSDVVRIFAQKLLRTGFGLDRQFLRLVIRSAPMHDLGKIGVDDAVLRKQGRFTDEEYAIMKKHAEIGSGMVRQVLTDLEEPEFVAVADNVAHYHHEKVNGTGYPCGLKGDEIPFEARIMALADVFDALVSKRCYKDAFSYDEAFAIIEKDAGSHFDPELVPVFLSCRDELEKYYNSVEN
ncbi:MAG: HD domain-containing protein [Treponema sp.]|nr:HD domain-containing protein [Candidatus Treponema caballi]